MPSLRFLAVLLFTAPACLSGDPTVSGTLPSDFECQSVHIHAVDAQLETVADQTDTCGFTFGGESTFSFSVPDGTEQLQVTFDESTDDGTFSHTVVVTGPIHNDVMMGAIVLGH